MTSTAPQFPEISGYIITEQLYLGSRTAVCRAVHNNQQLPVVIKVLQREYPTFGELVQFRNQYAITKNLPIAGIVQPLSLETFGNGYALVMADWGGISLEKYIQQQPLDLSETLGIAIQLADILHELHQHRVIHKDIKPANILIHPESKQVKLIDFSIASVLPKETQEIQNPNTLEGTLAYLAPEQTGRMNRGIDYRSDFYALGITLYELFTGSLPFVTNDPLELVHCHIAKIATPVHQVNTDVPEMLGAIVAKLMAKNAEDRYQSALGLKHDLQECLNQWKETESIAEFELGQRDLCDRFNIPEKLYGREKEVQTLLGAFERVSEGASELMLVAGFSGIGKTAVVNEVHKPIVKQRGYFIKGKFDQFNRNIPFSAFVQAFRDVMGQLLSESDEQLAQWRTQILAAVGENGQVLIEVIPELEQIIGEQPAVPELSGSAAQNRFNLLLQKFIAVFTTQEHPLVMFLDDLQWADSASLSLLKLLLTDAQQNHLLVIGAYRDNEVFPAHPLMLAVDDIQKIKASINTLTLAPLSQSDVNHLIADAFSCTTDLALPFTELVYQKTAGNPFFTTQFLKALHEDGLITFNWEVGSWQCDIATVRSLALTDDVVEFMALQLQKLPPETQAVLKLAACVGNQFDLVTLAIVSEQSEQETASALWKALQEGFVIPTNEVYKFYQNSSVSSDQSISQITDRTKKLTVSYKFLHDRVQQAAYFLIPDSQKQATHLKVGQLILNSTSSETLEAKIFDIVNQLNKGSEIILQQSEKDNIAQLNLMAGKKAKTSTAYKAAVDYFKSGITLLAENSWQTHYPLTFSLYREGAECEYLIGNLNQAEQWFDLALNHAQDALEKVEIYAIQLYLKMTQGENIKAASDAALKGLSLLGMHLPRTAEEQQAEIEKQLSQLHAKFANVSPSDLFDLPDMTDPSQKACVSMLANLWSATYMEGNQTLAYLSLLLMVTTSLTYGNTEASGFAYCLYGMTLASQGDYQTAYEFGTSALKLDHHFNSKKFIYRTNNIFAHTINPYNRHLKTNLSVSRQAFQASQEGGDVVFGSWAVSFLIWAMIIKGDCLSAIYAETEKYLDYLQRVNDVNMLYAFTLQRQFLLNLQDASQSTDLLNKQDSDSSDEDYPYIQIWRERRNFEHGINWYCFLKLQLSYLYGNYADAVAAAQEAEPTLPANAGFFPIILYHVYYPLSLAALYPEATETEKVQYWDVLQHHQQIIKTWADNCPENFLHKYLLLSAEMAVISGKALEAADLYDRAIAAAKINEYTQEEALANELAAKFYLNWGKPRIAQEYMIEAYYGYARWGAKTKVADLETRYPNLLRPILQSAEVSVGTWNTLMTISPLTTSIHSSTHKSSNNTTINQALDFAAILKASQALSSTIELDQLLHQLTQIIMQNSGGDRCGLVLPNEAGEWQVRAIATLDDTQLCAQTLANNPNLPVKLIQYVKNTQKTVVINELKTDLPVIDDYLIEHQPKSVLGLPLLNQGQLIGILYLKNYFTIGAFTSDRVEVLNFLCTQAVISLENARLYQQSQQALVQLRDNETRFQNLAANIPGMVYRFCLAPDGSTSTPYVSFGCLDLYELYPNDVMTGKRSVYAMHHPEDEAAIAQAMIESTQNLTPFTEEWRIITPSGKVKWLQAAARPERKADGSIVWDGVVLDVSDRKRAEAAVIQKSQALEQTMQELQDAQLQMVQSEKMASLGNLVAGVAHEINNPIGFLNGSIKNAKEYTQDLFEHLMTYQQHQPPNDVVQESAEEIDLEFLLEDLPKLLESMQGATNRIKSISTSLRTFSRADTDHKVSANLHEGLDSTLLILKYRLKANENRPAIQITQEYGDLPTIECFPGQLNQVFMNILANAIDVFDEMALTQSFKELEANPQQIIISTSIESDQVYIRIRDNGKGMSEEVQAKIFDHLFTTKDVGKGTGLGLAIARQIVVEKHGGSLEVQSELGQGTEFCIRLAIAG
ncbi:two-component hybrid sensor and regulator [Calothrix sp. NIES-4101]|nr:two-component hybrid sensor and regulator [Calothrix sp. NIES-4101]